MNPFEDLEVIGAMSPQSAAQHLREIGEDLLAERLQACPPEVVRGPSPDAPRLFRWPFHDRPWQYTSHAFGYIATDTATDTQPIRFAGAIAPDASLRQSSIKVTLDRMRVAEYPGGSVHTILFDFYARNQTTDKKDEHVHFHSCFRAMQGQETAVIGNPLFVGLNVGDGGVALRCVTVNVKNEGDEAFLSFLDSDVFRAGLKLAKTAQPVIAPFSEMVLGLTKAIAKRHRNVPVQEFHMGLDFSPVATGARLAEGSYVVVQIPDRMRRMWDWNEWIYDNRSGQILSRADPEALIPLNYVVLGVSRWGDEP